MSDKDQLGYVTPYARQRASAVCVAFGLWGVLALTMIIDWRRSWPLVVFYAALLVNSYFSVRTFASITPRNHIGQQFLDILLAFCLALLPMNYNFVQNFVLVTTALFIIATLKYIFLLPLAGFSKLLYRKIRIDAIGILFCFLAIVGILWGYGRWATQIWAVIFVLANFYVLYWEPHYSLDLHYDENIK